MSDTIFVIIFTIILIFGPIIFYLLYNNYRWTKIEELNQKVGISRQNSYIDSNGYLRWKENDRLCHRDIAWEHEIRGNGRFGDCDVHHKDENKFNNNPVNLEVLQRIEHQIEHKQVIYRNGKKYRKLAGINKIYRETNKAFLIARKWVPKSQSIIVDDVIYIPQWLYREKGFD